MTMRYICTPTHHQNATHSHSHTRLGECVHKACLCCTQFRIICQQMCEQYCQMVAKQRPYAHASIMQMNAAPGDKRLADATLRRELQALFGCQPFGARAFFCLGFRLSRSRGRGSIVNVGVRQWGFVSTNVAGLHSHICPLSSAPSPISDWFLNLYIDLTQRRVQYVHIKYKLLEIISHVIFRQDMHCTLRVVNF